MNDIIKAIIERRSCKNYKPDVVPQEIIEQIIEAGLFAASGMGKQSPVILAVSDKETRDKIAEINTKYHPAHPADPFYGAPVVLVVLAPKDAGTGIYDGSLVMGNLMLAAHACGVGSCWIHRAREVFDTPKWRNWLRSIGVDDSYEGIGNCVIGYPEGDIPGIKATLDGRVFFA